jgi:hypothetical protein
VLRPAWATVLLLACVVAASCQTLADPYVSQSSLHFEITNTNVATQRAPLPAPQITIWTVTELSVHALTNYDGTYSFLESPPCTYQLNALLPIPLLSACQTSGLSLAPGAASSAILRISISNLELRAGARPDIAVGADPDGDGVPNGIDNCPIVFNPDQENVDEGLETFVAGDACSDDNTAVPPSKTIADQDLDGVRDSIDNCLWYPNPLATGETTPLDSNRDGIGDACERIAPVVFDTGQLTLECSVNFVTASSKLSVFRIDFGRSDVLICDAGFTGCILNPAAIQVELLGSTETFPCTVAQ